MQLLWRYGGEPFRGLTHQGRQPEAGERETSLVDPNEPLMPGPRPFFARKLCENSKPTIIRKDVI
jgi:hypothetical protein